MARDQKTHASDKEVADAPPVAAPVSSPVQTDQQKEQFYALIRALARHAARVDHDANLAKTPKSRHSTK